MPNVGVLIIRTITILGTTRGPPVHGNSQFWRVVHCVPGLLNYNNKLRYVDPSAFA